MNRLRKKLDLLLTQKNDVVLPAEYRKADYVYPANNNGYIETDIIHYKAMNYEINTCLKFVTFTGNYMFSGWGNCRWIGTVPYTNNDGTYGAIFRSGLSPIGDTPNVELNKYYNWKTVIDNNNNTATNSIDDRADLTHTTTTLKFVADTYKFFIFRTYNYNAQVLNYPYYTMHIGIKSLEIKGNDNIIAQLIPCYRKSDNQAGFYNSVTGAFYYGNDIAYGFD